MFAQAAEAVYQGVAVAKRGLEQQQIGRSCDWSGVHHRQRFVVHFRCASFVLSGANDASGWLDCLDVWAATRRKLGNSVQWMEGETSTEINDHGTTGSAARSFVQGARSTKSVDPLSHIRLSSTSLSDFQL